MDLCNLTDLPKQQRTVLTDCVKYETIQTHMNLMPILVLYYFCLLCFCSFLYFKICKPWLLTSQPRLMFCASLNHKSVFEYLWLRGPNQKAENDFSLCNPLHFILQRLVCGESPGVHVAQWRSWGRIPACDEVKGPTQVTEHLNSLSSAASRN